MQRLLRWVLYPLDELVVIVLPLLMETVMPVLLQRLFDSISADGELGTNLPNKVS